MGGGLNDPAAVELITSDGPRRLRAAGRARGALRPRRAAARSTSRARRPTRAAASCTPRDATGAEVVRALSEAAALAQRPHRLRARDRARAGRWTRAASRASWPGTPTAPSSCIAPGGGARHRRHRAASTPAPPTRPRRPATAWRWPGARARASPTWSSCSSTRRRSTAAPTRCRCSPRRCAAPARCWSTRPGAPLLAGENAELRRATSWRAASGARSPPAGAPSSTRGRPSARRSPSASRRCSRPAARRASTRGRQPIPVAPAAHYHMGGIATDLDGRTSVPGLWAAGEAACTGVHGANRLASNSLLEGLVFGARVARSLGEALGSPAPARGRAGRASRRRAGGRRGGRDALRAAPADVGRRGAGAQRRGAGRRRSLGSRRSSARRPRGPSRRARC